MAKQKPKHSPHLKKLLKILLVGLIILIVVPLLLWGAMVYRNNHPNNGGHQASSPQSGPTTNWKIHNRYHSPNGKKRKDISITSVTDTYALNNANRGIKVGLEVISKTQALPGEAVSFDSLDKKTIKAIYQTFQNGAAFQQFNDTVDYSSPSGQLQWGDAGSKGKTVAQTPKPGDPYTLDGLKTTITKTDHRNFYIDSYLQYHAADFPKQTIHLRLTVNRVAGTIVDTQRIGKVKIEGEN